MGGVTLTANSFSPTTTTTADSDGLCFAGTDGFCPNLTSFNLSFSAPVQLISYQTGFISLNTATLTFTQGANSSVQTSFVDESTIAFTNQFGVAANQVISVTATNLSPSGSSLQIRQLTIDDAVTPVPEPLTLLGATAAMGIGAAFKRRSGKAKHK
ncbi:MAG: PEP-CTERM sorting domain-containing protein [Synechocystis sp.]